MQLRQWRGGGVIDGCGGAVARWMRLSNEEYFQDPFDASMLDGGARLPSDEGFCSSAEKLNGVEGHEGFRWP